MVLAKDKDLANRVSESFANRPDALLEILNSIQKIKGFLSNEILIEVANKLNISKAEIYGVVSFYSDYRLSPPAQTIIKICRSEACQAVDCEKLLKYIEKKLGISIGSTSEDNKFSLESVYCLGNCALGPAIVINENLFGLTTAAKFDSLIKNIGITNK